MGLREDRVTIPCPDADLDASLQINASGRGGVVLSHPHPLYGGNMDNPVILGMQAAFFDAGFTTLRFNFRGVGKSTGSFSGGQGERDDVRACLSYLDSQPGPPVLLAGYSFGAWVNAGVLDQGVAVAEHIMVAPPVALLSFSDIDRIPFTGLVVTGEYDDIAPPIRVRALMARTRIKGRLEVIPGGDHFFSQSPSSLYRILFHYLTR